MIPRAAAVIMQVAAADHKPKAMLLVKKKDKYRTPNVNFKRRSLLQYSMFDIFYGAYHLA